MWVSRVVMTRTWCVIAQIVENLGSELLTTMVAPFRTIMGAMLRKMVMLACSEVQPLRDAQAVVFTKLREQFNGLISHVGDQFLEVTLLCVCCVLWGTFSHCL